MANGGFKGEYVLDRLQAGEFVCRACYWRAWAKGAHAISGCSDQPVDISTVKKNAEVHGYTYLRPLTNPSLKDDPHATREGGAHDLVNLVPIHIRLLSETLGHGDKRAGDGGTVGGVFAE